MSRECIHTWPGKRVGDSCRECLIAKVLDVVMEQCKESVWRVIQSEDVFQPQAASSTQAAEKALRDALAYVGQRTDGDLRTLAERAELWMRESKCLINEHRRLASSTTPGSPCPTPSACRFHDECLAGSTGAVDALPAKWRAEAATLRRLAGKAACRGDLADSEIRLGHAQDAEAYADELEAALAQQGERPPYPEGDVVGPCVCGSWPGGKCLRCEWRPAQQGETS